MHRAHHIFGEGPTQFPCGSFADDAKNFTSGDFRFTMNPDTSTLYVFCLGAKPGDSILITILGAGIVAQGRISGVRIVGTNGAVEWNSYAAGLHVKLPDVINVPTGLPAVIAVSGLSDLQWDGIVRQGQDNSVNLHASLVTKFVGQVRLDIAGKYISVSNWIVPSDAVHWTSRIHTGGIFQVTVLCASPNRSRIGKFLIQGQDINLVIPQTASSTDFTYATSGPINFAAGNSTEFVFQILDPFSEFSVAGFQLASIQLILI